LNLNKELLGETESEDDGESEEEEEVVQEPIQINFDNPNMNIDALENNEIDLEQVIGLKGPYSLFLQNAATILITNMLSLLLLVLVPYILGRFVNWILLDLDLSSIVPDTTLVKLSLIGIGYLFLTWLSIVFTLLGNMFCENHSFVKTILKFIRFVYYFAKVVVFFTIHFILIPLFIGTVVDISTLDFFGSTLEQRWKYFQIEPASSFVMFVFIFKISRHASIGVLFLIFLSSSVQILREFLRPNVLWVFYCKV
jgi:hypothetical protein